MRHAHENILCENMLRKNVYTPSDHVDLQPSRSSRPFATSHPCIGLNGHSAIRKVELETGATLESHALPHEDFGEGTTRHGDRLYQLVWMKPTIWSYHVDNLGADVQRHESDLQYAVGVGVCAAKRMLCCMGWPLSYTLSMVNTQGWMGHHEQWAIFDYHR